VLFRKRGRFALYLPSGNSPATIRFIFTEFGARVLQHYVHMLTLYLLQRWLNNFSKILLLLEMIFQSKGAAPYRHFKDVEIRLNLSARRQ
jgi:hypothetical protein